MFCDKCGVADGHKDACPDAPRPYPLEDEAEDVVDAVQRYLRFGGSFHRGELRKTYDKFVAKKNKLADARAQRREAPGGDKPGC